METACAPLSANRPGYQKREGEANPVTSRRAGGRKPESSTSEERIMTVGLDYQVDDEFYRVGTYSEAGYFDEWLKIAGINTLPIDEGESMQPETAAMYLTGWLPLVKAAIDNTTCEWQGEQPPEKYQVDKEGTRIIAPTEYPLVVTVADKSGVVSPGGFRAGCPPQEFMETIRYITEICEKVLNLSVKTQQPIEWS